MLKSKDFLSLIVLLVGGLLGASLLTCFSVAQDYGPTESNLTGKSFSFILPNHAIYLYAITEPNTYTISFDGNGSTAGSMGSMHMTYDKEENLLANNFVKSGYIFKGWSSTATGEVEFLDQTGVKNLTAVDSGEVTLYAQRGILVPYIVKYYQQNPAGTGYDLFESDIMYGASGTQAPPTLVTYVGFILQIGTGTIINSGGEVSYYYNRITYNLIVTDRDKVLVNTGVKYGADIPLPVDPEWTGNTFSGWNNLPGDRKMPPHNLDIEAEWIYGKHVVSFDTDGGNYIPSITGDYGDIINVLEVPVKLGYRFVGWSPSLPLTIKGDDIVVKAIWEKIDTGGGRSRSGGGRVKRGKSKVVDLEEHKSAGTGEQLNTGKVINPDVEVQQAYERAYRNGITTISGLNNANPDGYIPRGHMAKMVVNFTTNVLGKGVPTFIPTQCSWGDTDWESEEIKQYAEKACALGIMGIYMNNFLPNKILDRAEFGTILSRLLWGDKYNLIDTNDKPYYVDHLNMLKKEGIMTQIEYPKYRLELRKWAWVMFMRVRS